jgi:hypothetical protein
VGERRVETMPYDKRDEQSGRFTPEFADEDFLEALRESGGDTTSGVAELVGCKYRTAYARLQDLREAGRVTAREVGNSFLWEAVDDVPESDSPTPDEPRADESPVTSDESASVESPGATTPETPTRDHAGVTDADGDEDGLVAAVREFLADRPPKTSHGTEAVLDVFELLRERGTMKTGDLKAELYPTYSEHYGSERAMWESVSRYLEDVPGIKKGGYGEWTYAGDDDARETLNEAMPTTGGIYDASKES